MLSLVDYIGWLEGKIEDHKKAFEEADSQDDNDEEVFYLSGKLRAYQSSLIRARKIE